MYTRIYVFNCVDNVIDREDDYYNDELGRMYKVAVVADFNILPQNLPLGTQEYHEKSQTW
jgi:hypothetical protein